MNSTFLSKYTLVNKIGEGSFSEVLKCEDKSTGKCYAAKRLKKVFKNMFDVSSCAEIIAMKKLSQHPNIVYMLEYHYEPTSGRVIFVFELMDMSLYDYMKIKKRRTPESKVRQFLYQILKGLEHLHNNGLFHRDIKPENILIKLPNPRVDCPPYQYRNEMVKLADLGSIRGTYSKPPYTEYISTRWYRSPECLLTTGYYGPKMDIWATGCVFYEMLTLKPLFPGQDEIDQLTRIHEILGTPNERMIRRLKKKSRNFSHFPKQMGTGLKSLTDKISEDAVTILKLMIQYDPDSRINVRRLLDHRFFRSLREDDLIQKFKYNLKQFSNETVNKNKGDFQSTYHPDVSGKKNKFKAVSRSSERLTEKKNCGIPLLAKTHVDVTNYQHHQLVNHGPLVGQHQMKLWGVNPNILRPRNDKKNKQEVGTKRNSPTKIKPIHRSKHPCIDAQGFSKTTSYLPQIATYNKLDATKAAYFQSKSFILPSRNIIGQFRVEDIELQKHKPTVQK